MAAQRGLPARARRARAAALLVVLLVPAGCRSPDADFPRTISHAWDTPEETSMGQDIRKAAPADPELSGIYVLPTGQDAFAARVLLAHHAERAIDLQTYILDDDLTGRYLLGQLLEAADRGVRVRLLVDDLNARAAEANLAALDAHPGVEVRLFNPFSRSFWPGLTRMFDFMVHPVRLNHRAHNKSFSADGAIAIVGGRNIGDAYFDASPDVNFADLDLIAIGPAARQVGADFDLYWQSEHAVPMAAWRSLRRGPEDVDALRARLAEHAEANRDTSYARSVRDSDIVAQVLAGDVPLVWARVKACADLPAKITASSDEMPELVLGRDVIPVARAVQRELVLVSPYFVPGDAGMAWFRELRGRGVRVRILTNALSATDVPFVHSGYERYRRELLELGVELHELQASAAAPAGDDRHGLFGSSGASLHAKSFVFDGHTVFVGSLNFDPRSAELNTEQGLLVESPEIAAHLIELFDKGALPSVSYRLELQPTGDGEETEMVWTGEENGQPVRYTSDPHAGFGTRCLVWIGGLLPIEGQL